MPKLSLTGEEKDDESSRVGREATTTEDGVSKKRRELSGSNRGSIGRKERLRNALTGRSDGSGDGADQPKELPESELIDFLESYDKTEAACYQLEEKRVETGQILNKSLDGSD